MAECGKEVAILKSEQGENAWIDHQMNENDIEFFCTMEEIVLEMLKTALNRVSVKEIPVVTEIQIGKGRE